MTDEYLRAEYDRSRGDYNSSATTTSQTSSNRTTPAGNRETPPFRYHFSDAYEVFKRDFKDQFGFEYPGAAYDFVAFDEPVMDPQSNQPAMITDGKEGKKSKKEKKSASGNKKDNNIKSAGAIEPKQKKSFNPFRRNKKSKEEESMAPKGAKPVNTGISSVNERQLVPSNGSALATTRTSNALANPARSDNSTALVKVDKRNNRPISMDATTTKEGKVTTTKMTFVRPDGTVETVTMKQGLPGRAPTAKKPPLALTNGPDKSGHKQLTNGGKNQKLLTNGGKNQKLLTNGGKNQKSKKPLAITNGDSSAAAKPKRKTLGRGGSKQ